MSAKNGDGIDNLKDTINNFAKIKISKNEEETNFSHQSSIRRSFNGAVGLEDVNEKDYCEECCKNFLEFFSI